jgi:CTP:molybdopterin cytidylyltransferase MocA
VTGAAALNPADLAGAAGEAGRPSVISVHNPDWRTGMGSSLAVGLAAVPDDCTAAVLALADQPLVGPEAVRRLIAAHAAGAGVAVACYDGQPRNPVLISRQHWAEVADLATGDVGARPFLRTHRDLVTGVECADTGRPDDIDTREDLAHVAALLGPSAAPP